MVLVLLFVAALALRICFGSAWPVKARFWDERYALENPHSILVERTLKPSRSFYPSPVFNVPAAAVIAVAEKLTSDPKTSVLDRETGEFGPVAYRSLRTLQALYGAIAVLLMYHVGVRMFGPTEGLLAASILAFIPWQVRAGGVFKPDALLGLTVVLTLLWSLDLLKRPGLRSAILAGLGIALAMSAKLTGGVLAIPLAAAMIWRWRSESRRLVWLVAAGLASAGWFVLLNPYWWAYPTWLASLRRDYSRHAEFREMERFEMPRRAIQFVTDEYTLGKVMGFLALAGFLFLLFRLVRGKRDDRAGRAQLIVLVTFPPVFTILYGLQTAHFKPNNFLPIIPFMALGAAHLLVSASRQVEARWGTFKIPLERVTIVAVLCWVGASGVLFVYRALIPTTTDAARDFLVTTRTARVSRYAFGSAEPKPKQPWGRPRRLKKIPVTILGVPSLQELSTKALDRADGELYFGDDLGSELYKRRADRVGPSDLRVFQPRLFLLRGPALGVIQHHFRGIQSDSLTVEACGPRTFCLQLPKVKRLAIASFDIAISVRSKWPDEPLPQLRSGDGELPVYWVRNRRQVQYYATHRFRRSDVRSALQLSLPVDIDGIAVRVRLTLWKELGRGRNLSRSEADVVGVGESLEKGQIEPSQNH